MIFIFFLLAPSSEGVFFIFDSSITGYILSKSEYILQIQYGLQYDLVCAIVKRKRGGQIDGTTWIL